MPVYNSEKYLSTAIDSVLKQSYQDFELILVNDGSTDKSGDICNYYFKKDSRIIVKHQDNEGISSARNTGLSLAKGEYIAFLDNDDEYVPTLIEDNYKLAKKYDADIVKFGVHYIEEFPNGKKKESLRINFPHKVIKAEEIPLKYNLLRDSNLLIHVWNGLYKREKLIKHKIQFDRRMKFGGEDTAFNYDLVPHVDVILLNPNIYYIHYKRYNHSTSAKFDNNQLESLRVNAYKEYDLFKKLNIEKIDPNYWAYLTAKYITSFVTLIAKKECLMTDKEKIDFIMNVCKEPIFNNVIKNKKSKIVAKHSIRNAFVLWLCEKNKYKILRHLPPIYNIFRKLKGNAG